VTGTFHQPKAYSRGQRVEIIPAIDIIGGEYVRLKRGDYSQKRVYGASPLAMAQEIADAGIKRLHLVDLDGAKAKRVVNLKVLEEIAQNTPLIIDVGGGLQREQDFIDVFNAGAHMATVGSLAARKKDWVVYLLIALGLLFFGVFTLVKPKLFEQLFIIALGIVAIVTGTSSLVTLNKYSFAKFNRTSTLIKGVASIIIGVLAVILPITMGGVLWRIVLYVLAAQLLLSAIVVIIDAFAVRLLGLSPAPLFLEGVVSLVVSILLFISPKTIADLLVTILGVALIVVAVAIGVIAFVIRKKRFSQTIEAVEVEIEDP
jgi:uncharacterized membrane protein HdeD (DUF308 family)